MYGPIWNRYGSIARLELNRKFVKELLIEARNDSTATRSGTIGRFSRFSGVVLEANDRKATVGVYRRNLQRPERGTELRRSSGLIVGWFTRIYISNTISRCSVTQRQMDERIYPGPFGFRCFWGCSCVCLCPDIN